MGRTSILCGWPARHGRTTTRSATSVRESWGGHFRKIFDQVVVLLAEQGHLGLRDIYVDGTKIEANANRYTFVWAKGIKTSRERIQKQLKELWSYVEKVYRDEEQTPNMPDFEAIDPQKVSETIDRIDQALEDRPIDKKVRQKLNYAKRNWPRNLERYDRQEGQMGGRNSMRRTDPDATFMRMKDDHMQNGQLKPGYNLQAGTNNQFIVNYSLAQTTSDTTALIDHVEGFIESYGRAPDKLTADAGYGSEENYAHLESNGIEAFMKYGYFHKEQLDEKRGTCKNPFAADKPYYDGEGGRYFCPHGAGHAPYGKLSQTDQNGTCTDNPPLPSGQLRGACHGSEGNRVVERNHNLARLRATARERLLGEEGIAHRKRRCWDVEAVFGNIKQNMGFKRFLLRGIDKVETEIGLIAMAHNLRKATFRA